VGIAGDPQWWLDDDATGSADLKALGASVDTVGGAVLAASWAGISGITQGAELAQGAAFGDGGAGEFWEVEVASIDLGGWAAGSVDGICQVPDGGDELGSGGGSGQEKGKDGKDLHGWV